jgi:hypothetical protein
MGHLGLMLPRLTPPNGGSDFRFDGTEGLDQNMRGNLVIYRDLGLVL